jgi:hypothetical protein
MVVVWLLNFIGLLDGGVLKNLEMVVFEGYFLLIGGR